MKNSGDRKSYFQSFSNEFRNVGGSRAVFPKLCGGLVEDTRADDSRYPTAGS